MRAKLDDEIKRLNLIMQASLVKKVDDWRRQQPDLPSTSEAIRRLVAKGLTVKSR